MSITDLNPEAEDALYFALDMAELELLADRVIAAGPTTADLDAPITEAAFLDWSRRYSILDSAAHTPTTFIPEVEFPTFQQMWADA